MKQEQLKDEIETIRDSDGHLRTEKIVTVAADPDHPLHNYFTWDDDEAAHRFRLHEAAALLRRLNVPVQLGPIIVKAPLYVPSVNEAGAYKRLVDIIPHSDEARETLLNELARVAGALGRARRIAAVIGDEHEIDDLMASLSAATMRIGASIGEPEDA